MEIICTHCQKEFILPLKKSVRRNDKVHKITSCPHCGRKNYVSVLQCHGYNENK